MKIETHPRDDHQMTVIVEAEPEKLDGARRKAARRIAQKVKIPGFRPGKAPYDVVHRLYGEAVITEEAVEILVDELYPLALKEAEIKPAAPGSLEKIESLEPPTFVFTIPLEPTVSLGEYQSIRKPYEWVEPSESEVEEEIENLRRMYANTETVERPAQVGDYALVDVTGKKAKAAEDESPLIERSGFALTVRETEKEGEWPFEGFAAKLLGLEPGKEIEFSHKFAKDHEQEDWRGQKVEFTVRLKTLRAVNLPALDDDFAKQSGLGSDVATLRVRMRENVNHRSQEKYDDTYYEALLDEIKNSTQIKYPPQVLEHEAEHVAEDIERRLKSQGVESLDTYLKMINSTREAYLQGEVREVAAKRLERGLLMDEIARAENIQVDEKSLEEEFSNAWATLSYMDEEFARRTQGGTKAVRELVDAVAMQAANRLMTRKTLERLKEIASPAAAAEPEASEEPVEEKPKAAKKTRKKSE